MTLRKYLITMAFTTLICWVSFLIVLFRIDPGNGSGLGLTLFFLALFFALWGTLSLLGFLVRFGLKRQETPFKHIGISLRQALWFAILVCLTLLLVSQELLVWWMSLILVAGLAVLEGFFLARSLGVKHHHQPKLKNY
ncbi:MAG: hypothetical protein A2233_00210 [Candidatus Kerfeldbacteria bacterium RIFOXYA2_FULL_38_24]|uniref:Uncharacterized protein n=1 Tax=Candidatus Kerfeldbacteria bacterium RIFOXYB2_FULL_38_14 TaxID=1798547 RepID=A0A1G2B9Y6_9BACT|nr:MAG: hypothetical protein A2233_00210 [Candidatus Kerfeldbacteria bacterium RIFOXYA2_FULL_38_24]OGY86018.1 MAG: hypothetical protein A2319_00415 [Candidatus Kerfeldbacteria bacterium RIFOXYB2_FULL_38_14]